MAESALHSSSILLEVLPCSSLLDGSQPQAKYLDKLVFLSQSRRERGEKPPVEGLAFFRVFRVFRGGHKKISLSGYLSARLVHRLRLIGTPS